VFQPVTKDVPYWLRAIDIFVFPSRSEASANSLIEAMACGRCVLASATGGNTELIGHRRTGLLFTNNDLDSLVAQVETAIHDQQLRSTLADNAARFARTEFSWETFARNMAEIYSRLLLEHTTSELNLYLKSSQDALLTE
jgi:glycosyltransferase involved in cell wall biosynthesis